MLVCSSFRAFEIQWSVYGDSGRWFHYNNNNFPLLLIHESVQSVKEHLQHQNDWWWMEPAQQGVLRTTQQLWVSAIKSTDHMRLDLNMEGKCVSSSCLIRTKTMSPRPQRGHSFTISQCPFTVRQQDIWKAVVKKSSSLRGLRSPSAQTSFLLFRWRHF